MRFIGPLFLLSGIGVVVAARWWGRGNETSPDPVDEPTPPGPGLVSFSAHPAAIIAPDRDGWIAALEVHVHTQLTENLYGTTSHPSMAAALAEARSMATARREELAA